MGFLENLDFSEEKLRWQGAFSSPQPGFEGLHWEPWNEEKPPPFPIQRDPPDGSKSPSIFARSCPLFHLSSFLRPWHAGVVHEIVCVDQLGLESNGP